MNKKKDHTPLALKFIRSIFPIAEKIVPTWAHSYAFRLFFTPFRYRIPEKERQFLVSAERFKVVVSGQDVQAYSWGQGPVVLMIHGWAGRAGQFRKFVPKFVENNFRVVAFDGPAHGESQGKQTNVPEFEEAIHKLIEKVGQPVAMVAHSYGGIVAIYSVSNGLPLAKLINIASPTIGEEILKSFLKIINASDATGKAFKERVQKKFGKSFDDVSTLSLIKFLPHPIKLLLVHDEHDREVSLDHAHALQQIYPSAELYATTGLGHSRILKDDAVINKCVAFVKS